MVDKRLLDILCCPETKQHLKYLGSEEVAGINKAITAGTLKNRGGEAIRQNIDAGLLREDGQWLYPIRNDIPIMLIDEAIAFSGK